MRRRRAPGTIDRVANETVNDAQPERAQAAATGPEPAEPALAEPAQPPKTKRSVIRIPGTTIPVIVLLAIGMTPIAWTVPGMLALYVLPAALLYWVLRVRTTATPDGLTVRRLLGKHHLSWSELRGLSVSKRGKIAAVTTDDVSVTLPAVRSRHLPMLSLISAGRLPDPTGLTTDLT